MISLMINGNLTKDVELQHTIEKNTPYVWITVACSSGKDTLFLDVKVWDELATNLSKFRSKGDHVVIQANIKQYISKDDKETNITNTYFEAIRIEYVGKSKTGVKGIEN